MSINLGNDGMRAALALRDHPEFLVFQKALGETADKLVDNAIAVDPVHRIEQTGYARCARDLWVAIEAARTGVHQKVVPKRPTTGAAAKKHAEASHPLENGPSAAAQAALGDLI